MFCLAWVIVIKLSIPQEMYPPKVHQFAYVTDEACTEDEILSMEIIIMKVKNMHTLILHIWHPQSPHSTW